MASAVCLWSSRFSRSRLISFASPEPLSPPFFTYKQRAIHPGIVIRYTEHVPVRVRVLLTTPYCTLELRMLTYLSPSCPSVTRVSEKIFPPFSCLCLRLSVPVFGNPLLQHHILVNCKIIYSFQMSNIFTLQRRGHAVGNPSSERGRKRSAQCLDPSSVVGFAGSSTASVSKSIFPLAEEPNKGLRSSRAEDNEPRIPPPSLLLTVKEVVEAESAGPDCPGITTASSSRVESALQSLSIHSPPSTRMQGGASGTASRPPGSSFILYSGSPAAGSHYVRPRPRSDGTGSSYSSVAASTRTPTKCPPLHGDPSFLMLSLDGNTGMDTHNAADNDRLFTPRQQQPPSMCYEYSSPAEYKKYPTTSSTLTPQANRTPPTMNTSKVLTPQATTSTFMNTPSSHTNQGCWTEASPCSYHSFRSPRTPHTPSMSIIGTPAPSSSRCSSRQRSSPRINTTPLPKRNLTPRSPVSRSTRAGGMDLPHVSRTSHHHAVEELAFHNNFVIDPSSQRPPTQNSIHNNTTRHLFLPAPVPSNENENRPANTRRPWYHNIAHSTSSTAMEEQFLGVKTYSLLTPSRSDGILLRELMQAKDNMDDEDEDGSLIDDDEDDAGFILAAPRALAEECEFRRPHQRRCVRPATCTTTSFLSSSAKTTCDTTTLVGMDIVPFPQDDSATTSPWTAQHDSITPTSSLGSSQESFPDGPFSEVEIGPVRGLYRLASEGSLTSFGLALEPFLEQKEEIDSRDLITPPTIPEHRTSPPPLSNDIHLTTTLGNSNPLSTSVCISIANPNAVNMTIARMAFQTHVKQSTEMHCSS
jgi:hypothetical protein